MESFQFRAILLGLRILLWWQAFLYPMFKNHLFEKNFIPELIKTLEDIRKISGLSAFL